MPKFAANLSMLFTEYPFPERFARAREAGFSGVEYLFPYPFSAQTLAGLLAENHLVQVLFNLPAGDWEAGERGIACLPDRTEEFRAGVDKAIDYARALKCPQVNCLAGKRPAGLTEREAHDTLVQNLRYAAQKLAGAGIGLVMEAINTRDIPGFFVTHTRQALDILRAVDHPNLKYQYDIYHMQVMEGDLANTIASHLDAIGHLQLADNPGRHEPGSGEINYPYLLGHIDAIGYQGWIGCEYVPAAGTADGLGWMKNYLAH